MIEKHRLFMGFLLWIAGTAAAAGPRHDLTVALRPSTGQLIVTDHITLDEASRRFDFRLNRGLEVHAEGGRLIRLAQGLRQNRYQWVSATPRREIVLHYRGRPLFSERRGHGGMPEGDLSPQGVYLDGASAWYPLSDEPLAGVRLTVQEPPGWKVLGLGRRSETPAGAVWTSDRPSEDLYLVAGPYHRYLKRQGDLDLSVWLLEDDRALAERYLLLMGEYIRHYSELIGPYPYAKFAVVENRWPTGLGMPSFTLLGGQVLRLPFIPYTSLPHEILHNWWGNGVWVDYRKGNWSEGLTAYLADHWMKERQGKGAEYRLRALQRYSNFAAQGKDMPLLAFVSRHDEASQSVGYSKSLMFFHMLRRALGDPAFDAGLRRLWTRHRFQRIGFVQAVQTLVGERPALLRRFLPWLERTGAPRLALSDVSSTAQHDGYRLAFTLAQRGVAPYDLAIPVAVQLVNGERRRLRLRLARAQRRFTLSLPSRPVRLQVDPEFDVLRYLDPSEQPPALSLLFGGKTWLVLPSGASAEEKAAWQRLARHWRQRYPGLRVTEDTRLDQIPADANRLLLGWSNRALMPAGLSDRRFRLTRDGLETDGRQWSGTDHAVVRVVTDAAGRSTGFIGAHRPETIDALARKLPHYGAYGVLVFDEGSGRNRFKAVPANPHSRLVWTAPGTRSRARSGQDDRSASH